MDAQTLQLCPTLRPHGLQPTRLLRPWDSLGKNTGVGCHFLLSNWVACGILVPLRLLLLLSCFSRVRPHRQQPTRLRHPWDSPGKNTGVDCHFLLQCMEVKSKSEVGQ